MTRDRIDLAALCDEMERLRVSNGILRAQVEIDESIYNAIAIAAGFDHEPPSDARACIAAVQAMATERDALRVENARLTRACVEGLPREVIVCPECSEKHVEGPRHDDPSIDGRVRPHHTHRCYHCGHVWDAGRWSYGAESQSVAVPVSVHESTVDMLAAEIRNLCEVRDALRAYNKRIATELDDARNVALGLMEDAAGLREIIAGRTTPPTEAEIEAHHKAGGFWMYRGTGRFPVVRELNRFEARIIAEAIRTEAAEASEGSRWWALGPDKRVCAWPVVTEVTP